MTERLPVEKSRYISVQLPAKYDKLTFLQRRIAREEYCRRQGGRCIHCDRPLMFEPSDNVLSKRIDWGLFPPNFLKHPIHLHHDHKTGLTIGAIHAYCNAVLWQYHGE